jgi:hypothetical protein
MAALNDRPDRPVVQILVDGRKAFADQLPGWQGFDPADMLGDQSPLLPEDLGRRVAVYRCSCGIAGCGVIAPGDHAQGTGCCWGRQLSCSRSTDL